MRKRTAICAVKTLGNLRNLRILLSRDLDTLYALNPHKHRSEYYEMEDCEQLFFTVCEAIEAMDSVDRLGRG